jgi:F420-non-reducing hydrogenase small subunit
MASMRVAFEWLNSCSGCEIAFLDIGDALLPFLTNHLNIVHAPLLMDHKYYGQCGDDRNMDIPEAEVGLISGGVANSEHLQVLQKMRSRCKILISIGTCASHGGIPALMNGQDRKEGFQQVFQTLTTDPGSPFPDNEVPVPLDRVYACDEKVKIDLIIPGCPPNSDSIVDVLMAVIENRDPILPGKSVCDTCSVKRSGKGLVTEVKRFLVNAEFQSSDPIDRMRCLLEQGFMCMGPVTAAGCAGQSQPSCIRARVPCRGCFGPVRRDGNQLLDMMNALASNGIDYKSVVDRRSLLRFSGAHGRLRPVRKK